MNLQHSLQANTNSGEPEKGWSNFVLQAREELIKTALLPWSSPNKSLLEINCAGGLLQRPLRNLGFTVHGCEASFHLRELFYQRLGAGFFASAGDAQRLPFENAQFDYALLRLRGKTPQTELQVCIEEASRVTEKGFALLFWNTLSLSGWRIPSIFPESASENILTIIKILLRLYPQKKLFFTSSLFGPSCTWHFSPMCQQLNKPRHLCIGSMSVIRIELSSTIPLTSTPLVTWSKIISGKSLAGEGANCQVPSPAKRA